MTQPAHIQPSDNHNTPFVRKPVVHVQLQPAQNALQEQNQAQVNSTRTYDDFDAIRMTENPLRKRMSKVFTANAYTRNPYGALPTRKPLPQPPVSNPYGQTPTKKAVAAPPLPDYTNSPDGFKLALSKAAVDFQESVENGITHEAMKAFAKQINQFSQAMPKKELRPFEKQIEKLRKQLIEALIADINHSVKQIEQSRKNKVPDSQDISFQKLKEAHEIIRDADLLSITSKNLFIQHPLVGSMKKLDALYRDVFKSYLAKAVHILKNGPGDFEGRLQRFDAKIRANLTPDQKKQMLDAAIAYYKKEIAPALKKDPEHAGRFFYYLADRNPPLISEPLKQFLLGEKGKIIPS